MDVAEQYTYQVRWSMDDNAHVATVAELPSVSWLAQDREEAIRGVVALAHDIVTEMAASGENPPSISVKRG